MKRIFAVIVLSLFCLIMLVPLVHVQSVSAQSTYTITQVDHAIDVMYTGQVAVVDTIHVSGQVTDGFTIALPSKYSADILKAEAYDQNNIYPVNLGVQLGNQSGFYGASINFNGQSPSVFTVVFVLSNNVLSVDPSSGDYILDYPAYPALAQTIGTCNVTITLPGPPQDITITKDDGTVDGDGYSAQNLAAYTYSVGSADIQIPSGTIQIADITQLNRQVNIDPTGKVSVADNYHIVSNATEGITNFVFNLPINAQNVAVKDQFGDSLSTSSSTTRDILLANATLASSLSAGQSISITASYNLPKATIQGSTYTLNNFPLFADAYYYVDQATFTFNPPQGATIVTPQVSSLDNSATVTRSTFQDTLSITQNGISYIDYNLPGGNTVQFSFDYNPVWVSFLPTFWVSALAVIGCFGAVILRRRRPSEKEIPRTPSQRSTTVKTQEVATVQVSKPIKTTETIAGIQITPEVLKEFADAYEEKKELNTELKSLDTRAQKGKIPRRQYKVQRRAIEIRLENITKNTDRLKDALRNSSTAYADLIRQLDSAEEDLNEAEEGIRKIESQQSTGEISLEAYKRNIGDLQKRRDKAESTMNGILLRLREKAR